MSRCLLTSCLDSWDSARDAACMDLLTMDLHAASPPLYAARRALVVDGLRTGIDFLATAPPPPKRTPAAEKAKRELRRKLYVRKARAQTGLLMDMLTPDAFADDALSSQMRALFIDTQQSEPLPPPSFSNTTLSADAPSPTRSLQKRVRPRPHRRGHRGRAAPNGGRVSGQDTPDRSCRAAAGRPCQSRRAAACASAAPADAARGSSRLERRAG